MQSSWPWSMTALEHAAFVAAGLLTYVLVTRIGRQRRHPSAALAWVVGISAFPYLALPLFLVFGTRKFARPPPRRLALRPRQREAEAVPRWATSLLAALDVDPVQHTTSIEFHADGARSLQALLALCARARQRLDVGTFFVGNDEVGAATLRCLAEAAARGVRTRLLIDAIGSRTSSRRGLDTLRAAGVAVVRFMPLLHNPSRGRTNLRNHRKLAVADGLRLWSGGRNLAAEYFLDRPGQPAWADLSFTIEGSLADSAQAQFEQDWRLAGGAPAAAPVPAPDDAAGRPGPLAQWVPTGPDRADDTVYALLLAAAHHATQRILAVTPYFVPDDALLDAWCMACRRGVRLCLVVPARSNHRLADLARELALRRLVAAGAEVRLASGMVHAKAVVVDTGLALCGSVNLDGRSLFLNYEVMTAFYGIDEIEWLARWIEALGGRASPHRGETPSLPRDVLEGVVRSVGFQL